MAVTKFCCVEECVKPVLAKCMCSMHYYRVKKHGDPQKGGVNVSGKLGSNIACSIEGCDTHAFSKGMCQKHYARNKKWGDPNFVAREAAGGFSGRVRPEVCVIPGCGKPHQSLGYCATHYQRHRSGKDLTVPVKERRQGEKYLDGNGYVVLPGRREGHVVLEHRDVMEAMIGRPLRKGENVHHKNGDRADNRPENLELWVSTQPAGQRPEDLVKWAREILALYGPLVEESCLERRLNDRSYERAIPPLKLLS
ncbi:MULTISPECIES: HNH endonuclease [Methylobacterium]|uniref:HNH endonuclease n=1 Tax=Methylobacterium TaxID=407 RepID=UPI001FF00CE0|nr:HNH endonuclease [Methylobacterium organophilum]